VSTGPLSRHWQGSAFTDHCRGEIALSRIAQGLPLADQCLHSAEADVPPQEGKSGVDPERSSSTPRHAAGAELDVQLISGRINPSKMRRA
jgi:hypothetical protein